MSRIAVFPGSFDPMTTGHLALLRRALPLFDRIVVAVGINTEKKGFMPVDERVEHIRMAVAAMPKVEVTTYSCLTTDLCRQLGASYILRGVRDAADFAYEQKIADINRLIAPDIETVILLADPSTAIISSSMVRELAAFGKDINKYLA
ncbi:MAG: pantetheine-phosphate adenylyltransferase [Bacteroidales bacterium]|nr:pantetheine-phosphate adenylyltransferase [Bacteroidales bacterium]